MTIDRSQVTTGMSVVDAEGGQQGAVKEVRAKDFLVDRSIAPDVYVRYVDVKAVSGDTVTLNLSARQIDDQSWVEGP